MAIKYGIEEARRRISEERELKTCMLDLSGLGLTDLPDETFDLAHLKVLKIGCHQSKDSRGMRLNLITSLSRIAELSNLEYLDCRHTQISALSPLASLSRLEWLDCGATRVTDLSPLLHLSELHTLGCILLEVTDLGPISHL